MLPTSKKLTGILVLGCLCVRPSVCSSRTVHDRLLKFHIWIPPGKIADRHIFVLSELSPFLELCTLEKVKSDAYHIL